MKEEERQQMVKHQFLYKLRTKMRGGESDHTEIEKCISGTRFGFANSWLGNCLGAMN